MQSPGENTARLLEDLQQPLISNNLKGRQPRIRPASAGQVCWRLMILAFGVVSCQRLKHTSALPLLDTSLPSQLPYSLNLYF